MKYDNGSERLLFIGIIWLTISGGFVAKAENDRLQPLRPSMVLSRAASLSAACSGCHAGADQTITSLDNHSMEDIRSALLAYQADQNGNNVMHRLMRGYSDADITLISNYLARQED